MFVHSDSTVPKLQTAEDLQGDALSHYDAEIELMNLILLSIPNDIYNSVDACTSAKDIWKRVERLMRGTIQNKVDRETRFTNEFDQFVAEPGEAIVFVYNRFAQLMNDLEQNDMHFPIVTINTKFLNSLQPEWLKYQFEKLVNTSRVNKLEKSHDPLALVAHTGSSFRNTSSYYVTHPTSVVDYDDEYQQDDIQTNSNDPLTSAMLLLARAITQNFSNLTNNRLRTSSNTRIQAIIQGDRVNIQSRNSSNTGRNNRRAYVQKEVVEGANETRNLQRTLRNSSLGNTSTVQCYNCSGKGHYARNCLKPRVRDSKYFMEQMLLAKQDEAEVIMTDEQNDFLFADASRMEEIKDLSANICLMARIQPTNHSSDDGPSYDSAFISEQLKHGLGYSNPYTLKQAISQCPKLYLASSLGNSEISLNVRDNEDTLDDASKSQQKVKEKMNDPIAIANKQNCWTVDYQQINALYKYFVPQKELSAEQKYFPSSFIYSDKNSNATASILTSMPSKSVNTKFDTTNGFQTPLCVTPINKHAFQKKIDVLKTEKNHVVSKPVTLQTSPDKQTGVNSNKNVIAPGMYKVVTPQETQNAKSDLSSTGINAASSVRRSMNKDSHDKNSVLANFKNLAKKVAVYVRKNKQTDNTSANVISNKENVIDVDVANASKAKNLLCVSCMQNVLIPCHDKCLVNHRLNMHLNARRTLSAKSRTPKSSDTTYVVLKTRFSKKLAQSKTLDTTFVVSKPKIDVGISSKAKYKIVDSGCSKHITGDRSLLRNFIEKFMGTVRFGNNNLAAITSYGNYIQGSITIYHVYYVEGLGHNIFSVGQFCDGNLEVAFHSKTCYVRNLEGFNLLTGGRESNLYTISISYMAASSPVCLMSKATSTKSWGKSKKASHPPKLVPCDNFKLELLHMDLCGPMRVASINGKKYILVIVDDYSRYTWVCFLHSKDETLEIIKKFIAQAQLNYKAKVCKIRTNDGTKFKNATLKANYEKLGLMRKFSTAQHEAPPIETTFDEQTSPISLTETDELHQDDFVDFDGNSQFVSSVQVMKQLSPLQRP
nr:hypothetical protein [Tanacetum cinerariifolium]